MAEQLPFSCLCNAVVERKRRKKSMERERTGTQNGEDRIMKIQELVYNRPDVIRSQVGSVSTFGCMLQFCILFSPLQLMYNLFSSVQAKSKTEQCQCIIVLHKRERECCNYVCVLSLVLAFVSVHMFMCICMFLYVCVHQAVYVCATVSMCRWGVGVSCVLV